MNRLRLSSSQLSDKGKRLKHDKTKNEAKEAYDNILKSYSLFLVLVAAPPPPPFPAIFVSLCPIRRQKTGTQVERGR